MVGIETGRGPENDSRRDGVTVPEPIVAQAPPLRGRAVAGQRWSTVTFLHWRVAASTLEQFMPAGVRPDEFDGSSWVGLIGFYLDRATVRGIPLGFLGKFTEVNVRLYGVDQRGRRGVIFLSLEASRLAAVLGARAVFSIPYFWSRTSLASLAGVVSYTASRMRGRGGTKIVAKPNESSAVAGDEFADFLTARWGLFTTRRGRTIFLPNEHEPWPLVTAELITLEDSLLEQAGISGLANREPDSVLYSSGVTTRFGEAR